MTLCASTNSMGPAAPPSGDPSLGRLLVAATLFSYEMSIESKLPTRENEMPAQDAFDVTVRKPRNGNVENRETDTDSANKKSPSR